MESVDQNDLVRERDFYRAKNEELNARIKSLEFDNAELVKRDQDLSKRINELANKGANRPRPRRGH
jgi:predicted nuclease with TOPRIM domain